VSFLARCRRLLSASQRPIPARVITVLAGLLVLFALVAPSGIEQLTPAAFLRIPVEPLVGVALLLVLPGRTRWIAATLAGVTLGLVTLSKLLDLGFLGVLGRPFEPVLDWVLFDDAAGFLADTIGPLGAFGAAVGAVLLALALLVLVTLSVLRLTRLVVRRHVAATRAVAALTVAWLSCSVLGAQLVPDVAVASDSAAILAYDRVVQVRTSLHDHEAFAAESAVDAFRDTPADQLLTGLRGKDVLVAFVESYGRVAVDDPQLAPQVGAVLDDGTRRLAAAGYGSRSAFLTSPTVGGVSILAHSTLQSGLWIDNTQRYRNLVAGDHTTLSSAFGRAGWRTVAVMPGLTAPWAEGGFYGYDQVYDSRNMGYRGPHFSWAPMPDQFSLSAYQRAEQATPDRRPLMTELALVSSHAPWAAVPRLIDWNDVGDGSIFNTMGPVGGGAPDFTDPVQARTEYGRSIDYSVSSLVSYVETYGDDNLVLIFLGDHQPAPLITGGTANRDVPISIVARDPAVLDRIAGWGWQDGLKPAPYAPVWRMDSFRDRFLTAFGPQNDPVAAPSSPAH
jgi:hypothetical protein